jgi:hypothetical protein
MHDTRLLVVVSEKDHSADNCLSIAPQVGYTSAAHTQPPAELVKLT